MRIWSDSGTARTVAILVAACAIVIAGFVLYQSVPHARVTYSSFLDPYQESNLAQVAEPTFVVTHVPTPESVRAVYMTSWAAGHPKFRKELFDLVENTEVNAVVIDVKDYTGRISFSVGDPDLKKTGSAENRIPDIKEFIGRLHEKGVYVIGRISSFQDSYLVKVHPEWAVKNKQGGVWQDYKGVKWLDPGATPVWDYLVAIGKESYAVGFDELNFDYIRYPSDGDMDQIVYAGGEGRSRHDVMKEFFMYIRENLADTRAPLSIDLFGLTTSAKGDLGIGQRLEDALPYFDYVAPMVYPSHFAKGFNGFAKPAEHPYEVIRMSMDSAVSRALMASSSPDKLRPWLQAFDLGAVYTPAMVRAQIQATYDAGLNSWMLWNAASVYNKEALVPRSESEMGIMGL